MPLQTVLESEGFTITRNEEPPRLYFLMETFDQAAVERLRDALYELGDEVSRSVLIFDYFNFDLVETDVSLQEARDALVELGVKNVYRVGPFERLCKLINSLDYQNRYNAYFCLSYGELDNLLRMLNK